VNTKRAVAVVVLVNLIMAAFCGFAYAFLTERMIYSAEWVVTEGYEPMAHNGWGGGLSRYLFCASVAALLQLIMLVFNLSVLQYIEHDEVKINRLCAYIGVASYVTTVGIACIFIALSLS
jgi:hypothetical protein